MTGRGRQDLSRRTTTASGAGPANDRTAGRRKDETDGWAVIERVAWHLAAAWLVLVPLYLLGAGWVPSSIIALGAATIVALIVAALSFVPTAEPAPPRRTAATTTVRRRTPPHPSEPRRRVPPPSADEPRDPATAPSSPSWESFAPAPADEMQCRRCGGFRFAGLHVRSCRDCGATADPDRRGDVVVRSWLHHNNGG